MESHAEDLGTELLQLQNEFYFQIILNDLVQWSPDIVKVDIVKDPELVNSGLLTILLLYSSKIRVNIVKNPDLVNSRLLTKIFTISGLHCNCNTYT